MNLSLSHRDPPSRVSGLRVMWGGFRVEGYGVTWESKFGAVYTHVDILGSILQGTSVEIIVATVLLQLLIVSTTPHSEYRLLAFFMLFPPG